MISESIFLSFSKYFIKLSICEKVLEHWSYLKNCAITVNLNFESSYKRLCLQKFIKALHFATAVCSSYKFVFEGSEYEKAEASWYDGGCEGSGADGTG